jgi:hypothetical protein
VGNADQEIAMRELEVELKDRFQKSFHCEVSCGAGWKDIILNLICNLYKTGIGYKICQIKEKMGGLCFYVDLDPKREGWWKSRIASIVSHQ